jgi:hypothetical protein
MKTPREILLQQHQAAIPKLGAIRAELVTGLARPSASEKFTWSDLLRSLRWHLAAMGAACAVAFILSIDFSPGASTKIALEKPATPQEIWASLRERQRLFLEYSEYPTVEVPAPPGRRSEIATKRVEV